ncbi:tetratricopeptide repeat protein [Leclercia sp. UBA5958]|uniref:O-linked N-acetylglucosamine transferase family protein n=1 Tax=Leclercia sp. UBA5958 TaxID=1946742 RepID=UPI00257D0430|nr:tetratricopeptide repeat protein [Leclercia sp. UBA5958]
MKKSSVKMVKKNNQSLDNTANNKMRLAIELLSSQPENALIIINELIVKDDENPLLWVIATKANIRLGKFLKAEASIDKALKLAPNDHEVIYAYSDLLFRSERLKEAETYLNEVLAVIEEEASLPLLSLKAVILQKAKKYEEAQKIYAFLTHKKPDNWHYWSNLGMVNQDLGNFDDMSAAYEKSCNVAGDDPTPWFNRIVGAHYDPRSSADDILSLCKQWQKYFSPKSFSRAISKDNNPKKCLRIGLISDGFRVHPVGQMIAMGLNSISDSEIQFYGYSTNFEEDHITQSIKRMCAKWSVIEHTMPHDLDKLIRSDEIDILFDLCGYNANSRMQAFQLAPAPILIKWVGGLISSTGLESMDYLLSDRIETPEGVDAQYTEKLIRMPDDYICYDPPFYLPPINENPVKRNGYITFGCFNNASKINDVLLQQWAIILNAVPNSHLFLKSFNFDNLALREKIYVVLENHGVSRDRIRIEGKSAHKDLLTSYNDVDIALDPWPYSGGLTTCEAMVMGVPVVTLPGPTFAGRHSASHLVNAGLQELVASDWENYIDITVGLTQDLKSLEIIRSNLRDILLVSPLCDGQRFGRHFADAMRAVWQRHCENKAPAALTLRHDAAPYFEGDAEPIKLNIPTEFVIKKHKKQRSEFEFKLPGKISTMDYGSNLVTRAKFVTLTGFDAFFFILMDTVGIVQETHLPLRRKLIQHITLHALGDGKAAPIWLCLDSHQSSNLKPLSNTGAQIVTELKVQTSRLDDIHGLEKLDWFALDNRYDLKPVFEFGQRILANCLAVEVRVTFNDTHEGQSGFDDIRRSLKNSGFVFHCFNDIEYSKPLTAQTGDPLASTQMEAAKALFIPSAVRLEEMDIGQREKLAFILHVAYDLKHAAYTVLNTGSVERGENYLASMAGASSTTVGADVT